MFAQRQCCFKSGRNSSGLFTFQFLVLFFILRLAALQLQCRVYRASSRGFGGWRLEKSVLVLFFLNFLGILSSYKFEGVDFAAQRSGTGRRRALIVNSFLYQNSTKASPSLSQICVYKR